MAAKKKKGPVAPSPSSGKKLIPTDPSLNDQERFVLEAVRQFEICEKTIEIFEKDNEVLMTEYRELLEERNQKREEADKLVRSLDVSCGDWDRYTEKTTYDADALYRCLGRELFLAVGGSVGTETVYSIDPTRVEVAIATNAIPANVVPTFKKVSPAYHTPKAKV